MNIEGYKFKAFPKDDVKRVVWLIGQVNKKRHYNSTAPLIDVLVVKLNDNNKLTGIGEVIKVNVSELDTVRIGSIWLGQYKTNKTYHFNRQVTVRFEFNLPKDFQSEIRTIGRTQKINETDTYSPIPPYIYPMKDHLPTLKEERQSFVNSRLTLLKNPEGVDVLIPAFELFTSTYAFGNKQIRNDLISLSMQDVVNKYVKSKYVENDVFNIELIEPKSKENTIFLAYLAMNIESRKRISKISSALQSSKKSYVDVYPYHFKKMLIDCDGVWLDSNCKRFLVLRINGCSLPTENKVRLIEQSFDVDYMEIEHEVDESKHLSFSKILSPNLPLTSGADPRQGIGLAYHSSDVKVIGEETDFEVRTNRINKVSKDTNYSSSFNDDEAEELSSGDTHYGKSSRKVAQVKSDETDAENKIQVDRNIFLEKVSSAFKGEHFENNFSKIEYINENLISSESYQLGSFDGRSFLLVRVTDQAMCSAFVLEFSRGYKLNDCRGLLFNMAGGELSRNALIRLLTAISSNSFKYRSKNPLTDKMEKLRLPVKKSLLFNHKIADVTCFEEKYIWNITSLSAKRIFL